MTYQQTLSWMFAQLPMFQMQGASAYKKDLDNTIRLMDYLGNPHRFVKTVHVAGTNGKGSTSSMIASVLQQAGYKVGLYTSPHLKDFRERIKINGEPISESEVCTFIKQHRAFFEKHGMSFFEMTVGLAFAYFKELQVDVAVIEVGMGGQLDATNIIEPLVSVITNIGKDHMEFLGKTLPAIAREKAGIIKERIPIVIGEYTEETKKVFEEIASEKKSPIYFASDTFLEHDYNSDLLGVYQQKNNRTARLTIDLLRNHFEVPIQAERKGLMNVVKNTGLLGRWHQISQSPLIIADTAHNAHGLSIVMQQVRQQNYRKLHVVLGVLSDKALEEILPLFPQEAYYYFCKPNLNRGMDALFLSERAEEYGLFGEVCNSVSEAYQRAFSNAENNDMIYIGGSTFVVAEIL